MNNSLISWGRAEACHTRGPWISEVSSGTDSGSGRDLASAKAMVVESLLAYLRSQPSCKAILKLRELASAIQKSCGKKAEIVCDAVPVLLWLYGTLDATLTDGGQLPSYSCVYGGDYHKYADRLASFVRALRHVEIEPVFFFPTAPGCDKTVFSLSLPVLKARYLKRLERAAFVQQICTGSGDCWRMSRSLQPLMLFQSVMTLASLKAKTVQCLGNNLAEMAAYRSSNSNVIGILSTNSDLAIVTGSVFMDTHDFDLDHSIGLQNVLLNDKPVNVLCTFVTPKSLAHTIEIETDQLAHLAIICGNDYTRELNKELCLCEFLQLKDLTVASVAKWILKRDEDIDLLSFFPDNSRYKEAIVESYTLYSGGYHLPSAKSLCQYLQSRIKAGKMLNSTVYAVASSAVYFRQVVAEQSSVCSIGQPCTEELLLPLRKLQYAILGVASVTEYGHSSEGTVLEFTEHCVTVTAHSPSPRLLQTVHSSPRYIRISLFFYLIRSIKDGCSTDHIWYEYERAHHEKLKEASLKGVLTFTSVALFMKFISKQGVSNKLAAEEQDAILVTLLLCQSGFPLCWTNSSPSMSSISTSMRFSHLLETLYDVASLIGLQFCLPEPRDLFYPIVSIPFLLASTKTKPVSADIIVAKRTLELVLCLPSVAALRKACRSFFHRKNGASLKEASKLYDAAMSELTGSMGDIHPQKVITSELPAINSLGSHDLSSSAAMATSTQVKPPPGFTTPAIRLSTGGKEDLPTQPTAETKPAPSLSNQPVASSLPIMEYQQAILDLIQHNRVVCIVGEAGCGKSTMVPQFILSKHLSMSSRSRKACKVLVSQPRRVAAIKLARHVSEILGEKCGKTVGYSIGGEKVVSSKSKIIYCTCGYLLQLLTHTPGAIGHYSHIILDEIHERDTDTDFVLLIVRKLATEVAPKLKIILMSATMQGPLLVHYFSTVFGKKQVTEPLFVGFKRYPVEEIFIDEIAKLCGREKECFCDAQHHGYQRLKVLASRDARSIFSTMEWSTAQPTIVTYAQEVCTELIVTQSVLGTSVLVFFPGIGEIIEYLDVLNYELHTRKIEWLFQVFVLHSLVPLEDQKGLFKLPPPTMVNIILATDIAESSITLPSLHMVINFGIRHVPEYNYKTRVTQLVKKWCSRASCSQRAGRVGRVCKGLAVHLFPLKFYEQVLSDHEPPEMLSISLSKLVLQASEMCKFLGMSRPSDFLGQLLEPPSLQLLQGALNELADVGAIATTASQQVTDIEMQLTQLGKFALKLPLDVELSRLVLFSLHFGCAVEGIAIASSLSLQTSLFHMPAYSALNASRNEQKCLDILRKCIESQFFFDGGAYSDLIQVCHLFQEWFELRLSVGADHASKVKAAKHFKQVYGINSPQLLQFEANIGEIASHILDFLPVDSSVYQNVSVLASIKNGWKENSQEGPLLEFCDDLNVIRALIVASFNRGVMYGVRLLNCSEKNVKKGSQYSAFAINASEFNPSATLVWPFVDKEPVLTELISSILGSSTQFRTCVVDRNGLVEVGGEELQKQQDESQDWWENESLVNSPISEVKEIVLLRMHSINKARWHGEIDGRKCSPMSHSHRVMWYSLDVPETQIRVTNMSSRASILCDFSSSPAPLIGVTGSISCHGSGLYYARDLTLLPCLQRSKLAIILVLVFQPCNSTVHQLVDYQAKVVKAIKVNNTEIDFSSCQAITVSDLLLINRLRLAMSSLIISTETHSVLPERNMNSIQKLLKELLYQSEGFSGSDTEGTTGTLCPDHEVSSQEENESKAPNVSPSVGSFMSYYPPLKCSLLDDASLSGTTASRQTQVSPSNQRGFAVVETSTKTAPKPPCLSPIPESVESDNEMEYQREESTTSEETETVCVQSTTEITGASTDLEHGHSIKVAADTAPCCPENIEIEEHQDDGSGHNSTGQATLSESTYLLSQVEPSQTSVLSAADNEQETQTNPELLTDITTQQVMQDGSLSDSDVESESDDSEVELSTNTPYRQKMLDPSAPEFVPAFLFSNPSSRPGLLPLPACMSASCNPFTNLSADLRQFPSGQKQLPPRAALAAMLNTQIEFARSATSIHNRMRTPLYRSSSNVLDSSYRLAAATGSHIHRPRHWLPQPYPRMAYPSPYPIHMQRSSAFTSSSMRPPTGINLPMRMHSPTRMCPVAQPSAGMCWSPLNVPLPLYSPSKASRKVNKDYQVSTASKENIDPCFVNVKLAETANHYCDYSCSSSASESGNEERTEDMEAPSEVGEDLNLEQNVSVEDTQFPSIERDDSDKVNTGSSVHTSSTSLCAEEFVDQNPVHIDNEHKEEASITEPVTNSVSVAQPSTSNEGKATTKKQHLSNKKRNICLVSYSVLPTESDLPAESGPPAESNSALVKQHHHQVTDAVTYAAVAAGSDAQLPFMDSEEHEELLSSHCDESTWPLLSIPAKTKAPTSPKTLGSSAESSSPTTSVTKDTLLSHHSDGKMKASYAAVLAHHRTESQPSEDLPAKVCAAHV